MEDFEKWMMKDEKMMHRLVWVVIALTVVGLGLMGWAVIELVQWVTSK